MLHLLSVFFHVADAREKRYRIEEAFAIVVAIPCVGGFDIESHEGGEHLGDEENGEAGQESGHGLLRFALISHQMAARKKINFCKGMRNVPSPSHPPTRR